MAVNIMNRKFPKLEHHRNPSGCFNKANWLLKQSKRNQNKVHELVTSRILMTNYKMWKSWLTAEIIAVAVIRFNLNKAQDVRNLGIGNKEK